MQLRLIPLDDSILLPAMTATIAADVGDAERVFVVPRHDGEYARVGTVAEVVDSGRLPGGISAATLTGLHRGIAGVASSGADGELRIEVEPVHDGTPTDERTRELEREYRAVVEEILELRGDDGRVSAFLRSISEPGALADTSGYSPDVSLADKTRLLETIDVTERLELATSAAARAPRRAPGPRPDPRRRRVRRPGPAARVLPAQADGVDPQGARRRRRLGGRGVRAQDRRGRDARGGRRAGPARARPARADGRVDGRVVDDPHLPRLADRRAVEQALRREARPGARARGARRRPRRPRGRQGPDHRVHRRPPAAPRARPRRGGQGRRRDPDPDRPSRHRQDLDRRVDRARHRARVRPHVAGRRPRRGRDPRPPPHLHRRPPGPPGARAQGRRRR